MILNKIHAEHVKKMILLYKKMKRIIEILIFISLLLFFCMTAFSQSYKKLTFNDFKRAPKSAGNRDEIAFTSCSIEYSYLTKKEKDYYTLTFTIKLIVNTDKSWIDRSKVTSKKIMTQLLNHEQGHYNIAYLEQQELLLTVKHTVFYDDYIDAANKIFATINAKYRDLNIEYDADTQNSTNKAKQHKWDIYFQKKLTESLDNDAYRYYSRSAPNEKDLTIGTQLAFLDDFKFYKPSI
ncbi:MAG: hypothetical protein JWQ63_3991 [Mucilaginibacter sp.]|nr:hypothetical protein [Mucilaginibacter sp.]